MSLGFAGVLEKMLEVNGVTKADVARRLDVSPSTLTRWTNEPRKISGQHLLALARVLGVDPYVLMGTSFQEPGLASEAPRLGRPRAEALTEALTAPTRVTKGTVAKVPKLSPTKGERASRR